MMQHFNIWCPDNTPEHKVQHALKHVRSVEWAIRHCRQHRTAVQAGGNIGLWPRRLAQVFARVITFEPEGRSLECLQKNVPASVEVHAEALADKPGHCSMIRKSLGSHRVYFSDADAIPMTTIDALELLDLDYLQLDIEGYEWHALQGGQHTIRHCRPLIQVEFRHHTTKYGQSDDSVRALLAEFGYRPVSEQQGSDVVFQCAA